MVGKQRRLTGMIEIGWRHVASSLFYVFEALPPVALALAGETFDGTYVRTGRAV